MMRMGRKRRATLHKHGRVGCEDAGIATMHAETVSMRWRFTAAGALLALFAAAAATIAMPAARAAEDAQGPRMSYEYVDLTGAFARLHDDTLGLPDEARVAAFKARLSPMFPQFYGIERFGGQRDQASRDRQVLRALEQFPGIRNEYQAKSEAFSRNLDANIAAFSEAFPDFVPDTPIYLLHSLGEFDGAIRDFDDRVYLLFGADGLATYRKDRRSDAPLFQHELFHTWHIRHFQPCPQVWCMLWLEGLAVHVEQSLNPGIDASELVVDYPAGLADRVQAVLPGSLRHLRSVLDSEDQEQMAILFSTDKDPAGLPSRRGYYLGWQVARRLGRMHGLDELSRMPAEQVRPLIVSAIDDMLDEIPPP